VHVHVYEPDFVPFSWNVLWIYRYRYISNMIQNPLTSPKFFESSDLCFCTPLQAKNYPTNNSAYFTRMLTLNHLCYRPFQQRSQVRASCQFHELIHEHGGESTSTKQGPDIHCKETFKNHLYVYSFSSDLPCQLILRDTLLGLAQPYHSSRRSVSVLMPALHDAPCKPVLVALS